MGLPTRATSFLDRANALAQHRQGFFGTDHVCTTAAVRTADVVTQPAYMANLNLEKLTIALLASPVVIGSAPEQPAGQTDSEGARRHPLGLPTSVEQLR